MPRPYRSDIRTAPPANRPLRILGCMVGQGARTLTCPPAAVLAGKTALVTGGTRGIGAGICKGLADRGAQVIAAARSDSRGADRTPGPETGRRPEFVHLDLADLRSVPRAVRDIEVLCKGRPLDLLCANAGISPKRYSLSAQGHELGFAVNCLGHHALIRALLSAGLLAPDARVIGTTGDIYVLATDCSAEYRYRGRGVMAYCRSKLGNLWQYQALAEQQPSLTVMAVHPGVVATALEGPLSGLVGAAKRRFMISPELGAQATLIAATQAVPSGTYLHNTRGVVQLPPGDSGLDADRRWRFWEQLEDLA